MTTASDLFNQTRFLTTQQQLKDRLSQPDAQAILKSLGGTTLSPDGQFNLIKSAALASPAPSSSPSQNGSANPTSLYGTSGDLQGAPFDLNGTRYVQMGAAADSQDQASVQKAVDAQKAHGIDVTYDPKYGWIYPVEQQGLAQSFLPKYQEGGFDKALGVAIPALVSAGMMYGAGAGFGGMAAGVAPGTADAFGLQQMGQAAGLQGEALQNFVNSGGTMGSTAAGGGGVGTGAAAPFAADARFQTGMQTYNSPTAFSPSSSVYLSPADRAGLEQMAHDIGLSGDAAQAFVDAGGMANTSSLANLPGYAAPGSVPIGNFGLSPGGLPYGVNTSSGNIGTAAKAAGAAGATTALGKLLSGGSLGGDDLAKLLGTLGATGLGIAGGMDQTNAIKEANARNADAFLAAQNRAMATLSEAQKTALQSSGTGKDAAVAAYNSALDRALSTSATARTSAMGSLESAKAQALATLSDSQKQALTSSGAGRDSAIAAYNDALQKALTTTGAAQSTALSSLEDAKAKALSTLSDSQKQALTTSGAGRDAAVAAYQNALNDALSTANLAKNQGLGMLQAAQTGALGANQGAQDQYFGLGAPARARLEASYQPGFSMNNEPGYKDAIDQVMNSYLRKASTGGNPFENPGVSMEANKYVVAGTALPQLNTYRSQNLAAGNVGLDTSGNAALQRPGIYSSLGQAQSNLTGDIGKYNAGLISNTGSNIAGVQQQTGQNEANLISGTGKTGAGIYQNLGGLQAATASDFGKMDTNLINNIGSNIAGANMTAGQNDANLIGNIGRSGAGVLGQSYNTVPAPNSGAFNAGAFGLNQLTNPPQDYSSVIAEINNRLKLLNQQGLS